jgi:hypothetical protein
MIEEIYEKKIQDLFAGDGIEMIVVRGGIIRSHTRGWNNPDVVDDSGKARSKINPSRGKGRAGIS